MSENEDRPDAGAPPPESTPESTPPARTPPTDGPPAETPSSDAPPAESPSAEAPSAEAPSAEAPPAGDGAPAPDAKPKKKRRRKKKSPGGGDGGGHGGGPGGGQGGGRPSPPRGRSFVEDQIDRDAEKLARDARTISSARLRPIGIMAQEIRRMAASGDPRDAREARRALVLMKSKVAFLAGREQGRERSAFGKLRDQIFSSVDALTRQRETPDPLQLRNFLDHLEAFVGYHRYHADDRRRE